MEKSFFFPEQNSTFAPTVDTLYYFIFWLSMFFFVAIVGLMVYFMIRYRRVEGQEPEVSPSHNTPLEVSWSVLPGFLVLGIFGWGFVGYMDMRRPPTEAYEIHVTANMWAWQFKYPNGAINNELHIPVGQPIKLVMRSADVIHSLYVPAFRAKQDVVPGRYSGMWFEALQPGTFHLFCAEYCGQQHSDMITKVVVHVVNESELTEPGEKTFAQWVEDAADPLKDVSLAEGGKKVIEMFGCLQCHSLDGTRKVGPTYKGAYGKMVPIQGQPSVMMDAEYIRESILEPNAKIHEGYEPRMPSYKGQMKDEWIDAVIAYIQSLE